MRDAPRSREPRHCVDAEPRELPVEPHQRFLALGAPKSVDESGCSSFAIWFSSFCAVIGSECCFKCCKQSYELRSLQILLGVAKMDAGKIAFREKGGLAFESLTKVLDRKPRSLELPFDSLEMLMPVKTTVQHGRRSRLGHV